MGMYLFYIWKFYLFFISFMKPHRKTWLSLGLCHETQAYIRQSTDLIYSSLLITLIKVIFLIKKGFHLLKTGEGKINIIEILL